MDASQGDVDDPGQPEASTHLHRVDGLPTVDRDKHSRKLAENPDALLSCGQLLIRNAELLRTPGIHEHGASGDEIFALRHGGLRRCKSSSPHNLPRDSPNHRDNPPSR